MLRVTVGSAAGTLPTLVAFAVFAMLGQFFVAANRGYHPRVAFFAALAYNRVTETRLGESLVFVSPRCRPCKAGSGFFRWAHCSPLPISYI